MTSASINGAGLTDQDRELLRSSVRGVLAREWPATDYEANATDPGRLRSVWDRLAELGVTQLGTDGGGGGLAEIQLVLAELGRAACLAPVRDGTLVRLLLGPAAASAPDGPARRLLDELDDGQAIAAFSFAGLEADAAIGSLSCRDGLVSGDLGLLDGAVAASHLVACTGPAEVAVVALAADGAEISPSRALGADGLYRVTLRDVPAGLVPVNEGAIDDALAVSAICLAARSAGATRRAFELLTDYVKERRQFGRTIGSLQVIQHKLVNNLIAIEGTELAVANAAASYDRGDASWQLYAWAAFAAASSALRRSALETQHTFGAIGYAEEHEAPRHFKRIHVDLVRHGGARAAQDRVASHYLDDAGGVPATDLGPTANAFRDEVDRWMAEHWDTGQQRRFGQMNFKQREYSATLAEELGTTGWLGMTWPKEFGGQERGPLESLAFFEVMERYEAPRAGAPVHSTMLIRHGTPAQQDHYLPEILAGRADYGICYSEPNAGSDLASLTTRAVRDGDEWVIDGQKIWTTKYYGDYLLVATRTNPDAEPKQAGISLFIVPTDAPGLTIRPSTTMYDGTFANIFFDGVRVPDIALLGGVDNGWQVLNDALATERGLYGGVIMLQFIHHFELLCQELSGRPELVADRSVRQTIGAAAAELEIGRQLAIRSAEAADRGVPSLAMAAMSKVYSGELMERFAESTLDLLGPAATLSQGEPGAILGGRLEQRLRHSLMWVISLGTNEIQRNLIARRGLGLRS